MCAVPTSLGFIPEANRIGGKLIYSEHGILPEAGKLPEASKMMMVDSLTESARTTLTAIANQCPLEGGDAVYQARAMLEPELYADAETCVPLEQREERMPQSQPAINDGVSIYPNPTSGELTLLSGRTCIADCIGLVSVFDLRGTEVTNLQVDLSLQAQIISLRGLPSGVYLFQVTQNGRSIITERVVITN